jgi:hypothetical protein
LIARFRVAFLTREQSLHASTDGINAILDSFASNKDVKLAKDLRMKPIKSLAVNVAGRFRTMRLSGVLSSGQTQVPGLRTVTDPHGMDEKFHALCEALIASKCHLGP